MLWELPMYGEAKNYWSPNTPKIYIVMLHSIGEAIMKFSMQIGLVMSKVLQPIFVCRSASISNE